MRVLILLFFLPAFCQAQTPIELADQRADEVVLKKVIPYGDGSWIFSGSSNPEGGISSPFYFITAREDNGDVLWVYGHSMMASDWNWTTGRRGDLLTVLQDKGVLLMGVDDYCDTPSGISRIIRLDSTGIEQWQYVRQNAEPYEATLHMLATGAGHSHAIAGLDSILMLNDAGQLEGAWPSPISPIERIRWLTDSLLIVLSPTEMGILTSEGELLNSTVLPNSANGHQLHSDDSRLIILTNDSLLQFDTALEQQWSISLSALNAGHRELILDGSTVLINDGLALWRLASDTSLVPEFEFSVLPGQNVVSSAAASSNLVMTASTIDQNMRSSGLLKSYLPSGETVSELDDVEVLVELDSIWRQVQYQDEFMVIYVHFAKSTVKVVNKSPVPLEKVMISSRIPSAWGMCGAPGHTVIAEGLFLVQDDTVTMAFPPMPLYTGPATSDVQGSMCVVALSPNDHIDVFPEDNRACMTVVFPVGVNNLSLSEGIRAWPNPADQSINIEWQQASSFELTFIDVTGRQVHRLSANGQSARVDISTLLNGLYVLQLVQGEVSTSLRVVVQH